MAAVAAGPVYRLLGKKDLGTPGNYLTDPMPPLNAALLDGEPVGRLDAKAIDDIITQHTGARA